MGTDSSTLASFEERARAERGEVLELMKQRIEEANRPKAQSPELTASESERETKKRQLSEKQTELERQQAQANGVQAQQQTVETEVQAAYGAYCEVLQLKEQREAELAQLTALNQAAEADDDSMTNWLETDSTSMKQMDDELVQIKRQLSQKQKENKKLNKELETLNSKRDQAQARIDTEEDQLTTMTSQVKEDEEKTTKIGERVAQLDKALKSIKQKKKESDKAKIVNALFDKQTAQTELDSARGELKAKQGELTELDQEIQLQSQRMNEIEQRKQQRQADCDELTTTKKQVKMKLDVLSNIHAKRDVKVRQDLAREQEMRANLEGDIKSFDDRQAFLSDEIDSFKKIHDDLQSRYALAQKERQQEKNKLEKAEHEFWLKSREMERKVKDAEREYKAIVSQLQVKEARQVELEKRIHEINMSRARRRAKEQQEMARIKGTVIVIKSARIRIHHIDF